MTNILYEADMVADMEGDYHFFAASGHPHFSCEMAKTLDEVVTKMDSVTKKCIYRIWQVPLAVDAEYEFDISIGPYVKGSVLIGTVFPEDYLDKLRGDIVTMWHEKLNEKKPSTEDARDASSPDVLEGVN